MGFPVFFWSIVVFPILNVNQKLAKSRPILSGGDHGSFFMAIAIDFQEMLRRPRGVANLLAELKRQNWILIAMHDEDWSADFLQPFLGVKLRMY